MRRTSLKRLVLFFQRIRFPVRKGRKGVCYEEKYRMSAPSAGIDSDRLVDVVAIGTVMAIVCARIYYVAMAPFEYQSLWEMIDIRKGGIAIYGAVIGAFVFGGLAANWRKVPLLPLFEASMLSASVLLLRPRLS